MSDCTNWSQKFLFPIPQKNKKKESDYESVQNFEETTTTKKKVTIASLVVSSSRTTFLPSSSRPPPIGGRRRGRKKRRDHRPKRRDIIIIIIMGKKAKLTCIECKGAFKKRTATAGEDETTARCVCKTCARRGTRNIADGGEARATTRAKAGRVGALDGKDDDDDAMRKKTLSWGIFASAATTPTPTTTPAANKKRKKKKGNGGGEQNATVAAASLNDKECREILEELDAQVVFIDSHTSEAFKQCVTELKQSKVIAYDCEGVRLSRTGKITLLQIAIPEKIFLIDVMTAGGKEIFIEGGLKEIIQSEEILKLTYDVRMDSDALFHQHDVLLKNVLDLQLLDIAIRRAAGTLVEYLPSLSKTVNRRLTNAEILVCEDLKKRVKNMYTSIEDGDLWARRPLTDDARRYAALDAWVLMKLNHAMRPNGTTASHLFPGFDESWNERVLDASRKRIDEYKDKEVPIEQGGKRTTEMTHAPTF